MAKAKKKSDPTLLLGLLMVVLVGSLFYNLWYKPTNEKLTGLTDVVNQLNNDFKVKEAQLRGLQKAGNKAVIPSFPQISPAEEPSYMLNLINLLAAKLSLDIEYRPRQDIQKGSINIKRISVAFESRPCDAAAFVKGIQSFHSVLKVDRIEASRIENSLLTSYLVDVSGYFWIGNELTAFTDTVKVLECSAINRNVFVLPSMQRDANEKLIFRGDTYEGYRLIGIIRDGTPSVMLTQNNETVTIQLGEYWLGHKLTEITRKNAHFVSEKADIILELSMHQ